MSAPPPILAIRKGVTMTMFDTDEGVRACLDKGYHCSQTMMLLSLELRQMNEPFTVRAMGGLGGGMFAQRTCGALTGGACVLASYFARAEGAPEPEGYQPLAQALVAWFEREHGSINCFDLVQFDAEHIRRVCPGIIAGAFNQCLKILKDHGIDPSLYTP